MNIKPGEDIGGYAIISQIGSGGMGNVYLASKGSTQVAIKVLNSDLASTDTFRQRFLYEAQMLSQLTHPNIVQLQSVFEVEESLVFVMDYIEGKTLRQMIDNQGPIPEDKALPILTQILEALFYVHEKGIIHRDMKPSNIMIDKSGTVKVMDFGIARNVADNHLTQTGTMLGTPYYMSPEQIRTPKEVDSRSDIFSLGIVFFEMLSGRLPFGSESDSRHEIEKRTIEEQLPDPRAFYPSISQRTVDILLAVTRKRKEDRYTAKELLQVLSNRNIAIRKISDEAMASTIVDTVYQTKDDIILFSCERCRIKKDEIQLLTYGGRVNTVVPLHTISSVQYKTFFTAVSNTRWWISEIVKWSGVFLSIIGWLMFTFHIGGEYDQKALIGMFICYPLMSGFAWLIGRWIWRGGAEKRKEVAVISEGKTIRIYDYSLDNKNKTHVNEAVTILKLIRRYVDSR